MKLSQCTIGTIVLTKDNLLGHIVGLTFNCSPVDAVMMTPDEKLKYTIPLVKFPDKEHGIHHCNLSIYKG